LVKHLDGLTEGERFKELSLLLYEQAELAEGGQLGNPAEFVQRLNRLLVELATAHSPS
jgi:molecular chaperone HtpG